LRKVRPGFRDVDYNVPPFSILYSQFSTLNSQLSTLHSLMSWWLLFFVGQAQGGGGGVVLGMGDGDEDAGEYRGGSGISGLLPTLTTR
jgi:hypothetical protein